jgi:hypothetical protein
LRGALAGDDPQIPPSIAKIAVRAPVFVAEATGQPSLPRNIAGSPRNLIMRTFFVLNVLCFAEPPLIMPKPKILSD